MSYFDDMKVMFGRGMNAADRKTQEIRLQAEIGRIVSNLNSAYEALGRVVYLHPTLAEQVQHECPGEFNAVTALLQDEQSLRSRIEDLHRQAVTAAPAARHVSHQFLCPKCGTSVSLDIAYCPYCGDNLSELKAKYRICPNCKTYHTSDSVFCMQCGSKTVDVPVAPAIGRAAPVEATSINSKIDDSLETDLVVDEEAQPNESSETEDFAEDIELPIEGDVPIVVAPSCPNCGSAITSNDVFCGECGTRLVG